MRSSWLWFVQVAVIALTMAPPTARSEPKNTAKLSSYRELFANDQDRAELKIQPNTGAVSVYLLNQRGPLPPSIAVTIRTKNSKTVTLELDAIQGSHSTTPGYRGNLSRPSAIMPGSSVGVEVRIPWPRRPLSILRPVTSPQN